MKSDFDDRSSSSSSSSSCIMAYHAHSAQYSDLIIRSGVAFLQFHCHKLSRARAINTLSEPHTAPETTADFSFEIQPGYLQHSTRNRIHTAAERLWTAEVANHS